MHPISRRSPAPWSPWAWLASTLLVAALALAWLPACGDDVGNGGGSGGTDTDMPETDTGCTTDLECGVGKVCVDGDCFLECEDDGDCGSLQVCQMMGCMDVQCKVPQDCMEGQICVMNMCQDGQLP